MAQSAVAKKAVLIGGSAGSLDVIFALLPSLPTDTDAVYVVIIHRKTDGDSALASLLQTRTTLPIKEVEDKDPVVPNAVFLAPPDYHLLFEDAQNFSLDSSEKIHYSRPSIDVSFESAAQVFGKNAVGVLLSGANADGAEGLKKINEAGGTTIVQNPSTAEMGYMPQQAINGGAAQRIVEAEAIGKVLWQLLSK